MTRQKSGPKKQYGERHGVRLLLPVELADYIDSVSSNRTKWIIEAVKEKMEREKQKNVG